MSAILKYTFSHPLIGTNVFYPGGSDEGKLILKRHEKYYSLIEEYSQPITLHDDATRNGGLSYIKAVEAQLGPDSQITVLIEVSHDDEVSFDILFTGILDIESIKEILNTQGAYGYKADVGIVREDFWTRFRNRETTKVDLLATTDIDGNPIALSASSYTLNLPTQKVRQSYESFNYTLLQYISTGTEDNLQIGTLDNIVLDEIDVRENIPIILWLNATGVPNINFSMEFAGDYTFNIRLEISTLVGGVYTARVADGVDIYKNDVFLASFAAVTFVDGPRSSKVYTYTSTLSLLGGDTIGVKFALGGGVLAPGDSVILFGLAGTSSPTPPSLVGSPGDTQSTYFNIDADTIYPDTTCDAIQISDAALLIVDKLVGDVNRFHSDYFSSGCGMDNILTRGLNIRGFTIASKPFFMSFEEWWNGANAMFCLGLSYGFNGTTPVIRVENREYFYDPTIILNLDYVNNIERSYDDKMIFKHINLGYTKWEAEKLNGNDDPQTKKSYTTRFKSAGMESTQYSEFIAASMAIEQTRRNKIEQDADWKLDEDVFIIALNKGDNTQPERDEAFSTIGDLLNPTTRYNIRHSVARLFRRWEKWFNGCLGWYTGEFFRFGSGEGNFIMGTTLNPNDCEYDGGELLENQDIPQGQFLFMPIQYSFTHYLTWSEYKAIRDNRTKAVGISRTASSHITCFIDSLEYDINSGESKFVVHPKIHTEP